LFDQYDALCSSLRRTAALTAAAQQSCDLTLGSLITTTVTQLQAATSTMSSVSVEGVDLPVADEMKVLGVVLGSLLQHSTHVI